MNRPIESPPDRAITIELRRLIRTVEASLDVAPRRRRIACGLAMLHAALEEFEEALVPPDGPCGDGVAATD